MKERIGPPAVIGLLVALALLLASTAANARTGVAMSAKVKPPVQVQILGINDFHGNLEPPSGSSGRITTGFDPTTGAAITVNAGGVEYMATHIKQLETTNPNTLVVSAGDLIGASPLLSGLFHDEPTIESANLFGLDFNAVGNHEFDEGALELKRMQEGGCHPVDGCQDGDPFLGAEFQFLAANVVRENTGRTLFPAYQVRTFQGQKIAFIGMTLEGTPEIVTPSGVAGLDFLDEAATVNALVPYLESRGIEAIVVLIHEGGFPAGLYDECPGISGPIVDIVNRTSEEVDLFISGHTHRAYNCVIDGRPVTSAESFSRIVTDFDLTIDRATHDVMTVSVNNKIVTRDVLKDAEQTALILKYKRFADPIANRVIGSITADITRTNNDAGESALGDVIADAQLDATDDPGFGDAVVAFMNPGGIRTDLVYSQVSGNELPGEVTYGEAFNVQPFQNSLVTMTLTGAQIDTLLEQQFGPPPAGSTSERRVVLQVSDGFSYTWDAGAALGSRVDASSIEIEGLPIDPASSYRVTVNSFLADGGDGFSVLRNGTSRLGGEVDLDAFARYLGPHSPVAPGPQDRITRLN